MEHRPVYDIREVETPLERIAKASRAGRNILLNRPVSPQEKQHVREFVDNALVGFALTIRTEDLPKSLNARIYQDTIPELQAAFADSSFFEFDPERADITIPSRGREKDYTVAYRHVETVLNVLRGARISPLVDDQDEMDYTHIDTVAGSWITGTDPETVWRKLSEIHTGTNAVINGIAFRRPDIHMRLCQFYEVSDTLLTHL